MSSAQLRFEKRLQNIVRHHQKLSHGAKRQVMEDGLIVARPRIYNPKFPLRGIVMMFLAALVFKGLILASLGEDLYLAKLVSLQEGTLIEQAGAWIMQADGATRAIAAGLNAIGL